MGFSTQFSINNIERQQSEIKSANNFFQKLPHEDAASSDYNFVKNLPLVASDFECFFKCQIHENINSNDNSFDFTSSVELNPQLLSHVFVEIWRVSLLWQCPLCSRCVSCHLQQTWIITRQTQITYNLSTTWNSKYQYNHIMKNTQKDERDLFQNILSKFIINLPEEELKDSSRLSYHAEKAFYYYIDQVLKEKEIKDGQRQRNQFFFKLKSYSSDIIKIDPHQLAARLQENKPVCGAIIFNRENTKVLVVRVRNRYGFPKGKWNQHQTAQACAARQVQEETGIYIHHRIDPKIRIEFQTHGSNSYFFVARGVGQEQRTKIDQREIDGIVWMWIEDIKINFSRFVERSKIAWTHYEQQITKKTITIEQFIKQYTKDEKDSSPEKVSNQEMTNPFLNFKLDKQRLKLCLLKS